MSGPRAWSTVAAGDSLGELTLEMTPTRVVAGAIATRDFMPVHHDRDYAISQGAPDIFMNILSTTGYCSRFITDWAGPDAIITSLAIRLGVPAMPGMPLQFSGTVVATTEGAGEGIVEVAYKATNNLGDHVTGTATLTLPI